MSDPGEAQRGRGRDLASAVFAFGGAAVVAAWFLPFVRVEGSPPSLQETIRLVHLEGSGQARAIFLGSGFVLLAAAVLAWFPRASRWAPLGGALGSLIALYLVGNASFSFTGSPVNDPSGGPLLDDELQRLLRQGEQGKYGVDLRGRPESGFWLAFAGSTLAFLFSAYRLRRFRTTRRRALWQIAALVFALLVVYYLEWFVAAAGD